MNRKACLLSTCALVHFCVSTCFCMPLKVTGFKPLIRKTEHLHHQPKMLMCDLKDTVVLNVIL